MGCELISSSVHSDQNVNFEEDILLHIMYILSTNILYLTYNGYNALPILQNPTLKAGLLIPPVL